jgi:ribosome biogenesis GTPase
MSKRRISKQQSARIGKIQQTYHAASEHEDLADGLVITRYSKHAEIEDSEGKRIKCSIRSNLAIVVAGDRVIWQKEGRSHGVVVSVYPRNSILARPSNAGLKRPVAANITQLIIVIAPKPEISWPLLDSYLILAETLDLHALILLNKTDLPCSDLQQELLMVYQTLGYSIIMANHNEHAWLELLQSSLDNQISVFIGQSGVGKSSLISKILPHEQNITTNQISATSELGRHTTSNSRFYHLPSGGALIDSPGVREFSLSDIDPSQIAQAYIEFKPYISLCKFRNCSHFDTPECAILEAKKKGCISQRRYDNFIKLCAQFGTLGSVNRY